MKKLSILLFLFIMSIISLNAQNLVQDDNLKGPIKVVKKISYIPVLGEKSLEKGDIKSKYTLLFSINGKLQEEVFENYDPLSQTESYKYTYIYDPHFKCIERQMQTKTENGYEQKKALYTYDENKLRSEINVYKNDGKIDEKCVNIYNTNGLCEQTIWYDANGSETAKFEYQFDKNKKLLKEIYHSFVNNYDYYTLLSYNKDGQLIKKKTYLIAHKKNARKKTGKTTYYYNTKGDLEAKHSYSQRTSYEYKYDENDNWTLQLIRFQADKTQLPLIREIVEREIIYW